METKTCPECGETKPLTHFYPAKHLPGGRRPECQACTVATNGPQTRRRTSEPPSGRSKPCKDCGQVKPIEEFYKAQGTRDGRRGDCRDCFQAKAYARKQADPARNRRARERTRNWMAENPDRFAENQRRFREDGGYKKSLRKTHLKMKYGLTLEDYDQMLEQQDGVCAICGDPPRDDIALHVDHCHDTGRVRGLLCFRCNAGLGQFRHDLELLQEAAAYVSAHRRAEELVVAALGRRLERDEDDPEARRTVRARLDVLVAARDRSHR